MDVGEFQAAVLAEEAGSLTRSLLTRIAELRVTHQIEVQALREQIQALQAETMRESDHAQ